MRAWSYRAHVVFADDAGGDVLFCAYTSIDIGRNEGAAILFDVRNTVDVVARAMCVVATLHQLSILLRASGRRKNKKRVVDS